MDDSFFHRIYGVVAPLLHVFTGMKFSSPLANDNAAHFGGLSFKQFYSQIFGLRISSVSCSSRGFSLCHNIIMLSGIKRFVNDNSDDIILVIVVVLISLISFAAGYIVAKQQDREPLRFEQTSYESSNNWGRY